MRNTLTLSDAEVRRIAVAVADVMSHRQAEASKHLTERLKQYIPAKIAHKKRAPLQRAHIKAYYKRKGRHGLPAGVSVMNRTAIPKWKATFRGEHLGTSSNLDRAISMRRKAEVEFDKP